MRLNHHHRESFVILLGLKPLTAVKYLTDFSSMYPHLIELDLYTMSLWIINANMLQILVILFTFWLK